MREKLWKGEDLAPGAMLGLKSMQEDGKEIYSLPSSNEK